MELNLKNDIIFKAFFSRKGNEKFLIEFLEALLKVKIKKIAIKEEVNLEKLFAEEKGGRLDLMAVLNNDTTVDIEMQVEKQEDYLERTADYAAKVASREVGNGKHYNEKNKIILINILDFNLLKVQDYISETEIVLKKHKGYEIMKHPKWYFIELPKFRKKKPDVENCLEQWLLFIDDCNKEGIEMAESKNQTLKEARRVMNYLTGDAEVRRLAELRERWAYDRARDLKLADEKGIKKGEKRGKKEGIKEAQLEIAKKLLEMGKDMDEIMLITNLSQQEIENLQKEL